MNVNTPEDSATPKSWPDYRAVWRWHFYASLLCIPFVIILSITGCRGPQPITGGTPGMLRAGGEQLAEMQLTLHQFENGTLRPVGFAVTGMDGSFELVTNEAKGALQLPPGLYRCTLESAGSPLKIPPALASAESTPLRVTWPTSDGSLNLDVQQQLGPAR